MSTTEHWQPQSNDGHASLPRRTSASGGTIAVIVTAAILNVVLALVALFVIVNPQRVTDQFRVWQFQSSPAIEAYADRVSLTEEGRFLYFASLPTIPSSAEFDRTCSSRLEGVGILGCYLPAEQTILLYDVTDERLDGLEEVVAAHELLHAVWDRLSPAERDSLGELLEAEVKRRSDDPELAETLEFYATSEPGERLNELHSIVGSEMTDISVELEAHYAKFFVDRAIVTALHKQSKAVFDVQALAIKELTARIDDLVESVDTDVAAYNSGYDQLNIDIDLFNSRADSGDFSSQSAFNAEREALLARQAALDALYVSIDARATQYDALLIQLEDLNATITQLNSSINIAPRTEPDL